MLLWQNPHAKSELKDHPSTDLAVSELNLQSASFAFADAALEPSSAQANTMLLDARIPLQKVLLVIAYAAIHGAGQSHLVEPPENAIRATMMSARCA